MNDNLIEPDANQKRKYAKIQSDLSDVYFSLSWCWFWVHCVLVIIPAGMTFVAAKYPDTYLLIATGLAQLVFGLSLRKLIPKSKKPENTLLTAQWVICDIGNLF